MRRASQPPPLDWEKPAHEPLFGRAHYRGRRRAERSNEALLAWIRWRHGDDEADAAEAWAERQITTA